MYDIKWILEHPDAFDRGLKRRGLEPLSKKLVALDEKRRAAITKFEQAQARRNAASKDIGEAKKAKDEGKANKLMAEVAELKAALPKMEEEQKALAADLDKELAQIPNAPLDDVPDGADATGNVEHHVFGNRRQRRVRREELRALAQLQFDLCATARHRQPDAQALLQFAVLALLALAAGLVFFRTDTPGPSMRADGPPISTPLPAISDVK